MRRHGWPRTLLATTVVLGLAIGSAVITLCSVVYFGEDLAPFVIEKLPLPLEDAWLLALKVHVVTVAFAFPACLVLLSTTLLRRGPRLHRWLGRVTAGVVLLALVPSGMYLSLFAKGGFLSTLGFMLSGAIVAVAMVQGVRTARARRHAEHRRWALHVLAQMSVAVTSRAMLLAFSVAGVNEQLAYLVSLWVPVIGSYAAAELLSNRIRGAVPKWRKHEPPDTRRDPGPRSVHVRRVESGGRAFRLAERVR